MNELTPLVGAQHGTFFLADAGEHSDTLRLIASYGHDHADPATEFRLGQSLVGQVALTKQADRGGPRRRRTTCGSPPASAPPHRST